MRRRGYTNEVCALIFLKIGVKNNRKYPSEFLDKMKNIGFDFSLISLEERINKSWKKGYEETLKYKEENGDANSKTKHITENGYRLGEWQLEQRFKYKNRNSLAFPSSTFR